MKKTALLLALAAFFGLYQLQASDRDTCQGQPYGPCNSKSSPYVSRTDIQTRRERSAGLLPEAQVPLAACPTGDCGRWDCATCGTKADNLKNP